MAPNNDDKLRIRERQQKKENEPVSHEQEVEHAKDLQTNVSQDTSKVDGVQSIANSNPMGKDATNVTTRPKDEVVKTGNESPVDNTQITQQIEQGIDAKSTGTGTKETTLTPPVTGNETTNQQQQNTTPPVQGGLGAGSETPQQVSSSVGAGVESGVQEPEKEKVRSKHQGASQEADALSGLLGSIEDVQKVSQKQKEDRETAKKAQEAKLAEDARLKAEAEKKKADELQKQQVVSGSDEEGGEGGILKKRTGENTTSIQQQNNTSSTPTDTASVQEQQNFDAQYLTVGAEDPKVKENRDRLERADGLYFQAGLAIGRSVGFGANIVDDMKWIDALTGDTTGIEITVNVADSNAIAPLRFNTTDKKVEDFVSSHKTSFDANLPNKVKTLLNAEGVSETDEKRPLLQQAYTDRLKGKYAYGYNQGIMEGRQLVALERKRADDALKGQPAYVDGKTTGETLSMQVAMGQKTAEAARTEYTNKLNGYTVEADKNLFKRAYNEAYNKAMFQGLADKKRLANEAKENDENYKSGRARGHAIGLALSTQTRQQAETALRSAGAITGTLDQAIANGRAGVFNNSTGAQEQDAAKKQLYIKGFNEGYNLGFMGGRVAQKRQRDQEQQAEKQDIGYQKGMLVGKLRISAMTTHGRDRINEGVEANTAALAGLTGSDNPSLKNLAKMDKPYDSYAPALEPSETALQAEDKRAERETLLNRRKSAFKQGFYAGYNNTINIGKAQKSQRDQQKLEANRNPDFQRGAADGEAVAKAKVMLREYYRWQELSMKTEGMSSTEGEELRALSERMAGQEARYGAVNQRVMLMEEKAVQERSNANYTRGYNEAYNASFVKKRAEEVKRVEAERQKAAAKLDAGDESTPKGRGYKLGYELGKRAQTAMKAPAITPQERANISKGLSDATQAAVTNENNGVEGLGFADGFKLGLNAGFMGLKMAGEATAQKMAEDAQKLIDADTDIAKTDKAKVKEQLKAGQDFAYKYWLEGKKGGKESAKMEQDFSDESKGIFIKTIIPRFQTALPNYKTNTAEGKLFDHFKNYFKKGYEIGKKFGEPEGEAHRQGYEDAQNGLPQNLDSPDAKKSKTKYEEGYKAGQASGGFNKLKAQLGLSDNAEDKDLYTYINADGTVNENPTEAQRQAYQEGYRFAYNGWAAIQFLAKGVPIPQKMQKVGISFAKLEPSPIGSANAIEQKTGNIKGEGMGEKNNRVLAGNYLKNKDTKKKEAIETYNIKVLGDKFATALKAAEDAKKGPTTTGATTQQTGQLTAEEKRAVYDSVYKENNSAELGEKMKGFFDGYTKGMANAEKVVSRETERNQYYVLGFQAGFLKGNGTALPLNEQASKMAVTDAIKANPEYQRGYEKGHTVGLREKMGLVEEKDKLVKSDGTIDVSTSVDLMGGEEANAYNKGTEDGKSAADSELKSMSSAGEIEENIKQTCEQNGYYDKAADAYRGGYFSAFFESYNYKRGQLDGYHLVFDQLPETHRLHRKYELGPIAEADKKENEAQYQKGLQEGTERGQSDLAMGFFDAEKMKEQAELLNKEQQDKKAAKEKEEKENQGTDAISIGKKDAIATAAEVLKKKKKSEDPSKIPPADKKLSSLFAALKKVIEQEAIRRKDKELSEASSDTAPSPELAYYNILWNELQHIFALATKRILPSAPKTVSTSTTDTNTTTTTTPQQTQAPAENKSLSNKDVWDFLKPVFHQFFQKGTAAETLPQTDSEEQKKNIEAFKQAGAFFGKQLTQWEMFSFNYIKAYDENYKITLETPVKTDTETKVEKTIEQSELLKVAENKAIYDVTSSLVKNFDGGTFSDFADSVEGAFTAIESSDAMLVMSSEDRARKMEEVRALIGNVGSDQKDGTLALLQEVAQINDAQRAQLTIFVALLDKHYQYIITNSKDPFINEVREAFPVKRSADAAKVTQVKSHAQDDSQRNVIRIFELKALDPIKEKFFNAYEKIGALEQSVLKGSYVLGGDPELQQPSAIMNLFKHTLETEDSPAKRIIMEVFVARSKAAGNLPAELQHQVDKDVDGNMTVKDKHDDEDKILEAIFSAVPETRQTRQALYRQKYQETFAKQMAEYQDKFVFAGTGGTQPQRGTTTASTRHNFGSSSNSTTSNGTDTKSHGDLFLDPAGHQLAITTGLRAFQVLMAGAYKEYNGVSTLDEATLQELLDNQNMIFSLISDVPEEVKEFTDFFNPVFSYVDVPEVFYKLEKTEEEMKGSVEMNEDGAFITEKTGEAPNKMSFVETKLSVKIPIFTSATNDGGTKTGTGKEIIITSSGVILDENLRILNFLSGTVIIPRLEGGKTPEGKDKTETITFTEFDIDLGLREGIVDALMAQFTLAPGLTDEWHDSTFAE